MTRRLLLLLALLLPCPPAMAQDDPPSASTEAKALKIEAVAEKAAAVEYFVRNVPKGSSVRWDVSPRVAGDHMRAFSTGNCRMIYAGPPGRYTGTARIEMFRAASDLSGIKKGELVPLDVELTELTVEFTLGLLPPTPPGPTPPTPPGPTPPVPPGPTPPVPPPEPPAPIPADGLHVLLVYESSELARYPSAMVASWYSKKVRDYLTAKGNRWRIWDQNVDASGDTPVWQTALARAKGKGTPWLIVSNGKTGYEGPPPATTEALLALLKKYGGD